MKAVWLSVLLAFIIVMPFLLRNIVISGWLLYPVTFIDLFTCGAARLVQGIGQILGRKVYDEFTRLFDHGIGISFLSDGDIHHRRIGADGARPGNGYDIVSALLIRTAHHNGGKRIQEIAGLIELYLAHEISFRIYT